MAYNYDADSKAELSLDDLDCALGGANLSYEEAKEYAIKHGVANASHGGSPLSANGELTEEELSNYLGGVPYEHSSDRGRR